MAGKCRDQPLVIQAGNWLLQGHRVLALSLTRYQSLKFHAVAGLDRDRHRDFAALDVAWQYRWGGGF
jgi:hypothetical protein